MRSFFRKITAAIAAATAAATAGPAPLTVLAALLCPALLCPALCAGEEDHPSGAVGRTRQVPAVSIEETFERRAIERGLEYLTSRALPSGAIGSRYPLAVTSLAGLAFLGAGSWDREGPHAKALEKCLEYILASECKGAVAPGYFTEGAEPSANESRMHGHCFAVLFLTQIHGELPPGSQKLVTGAIRRGITCILRGQSRRGGWTYNPWNPENDDEASVTIGALQALRAAHNSGFAVPAIDIEQAKDYVRRCQNPDGSFRYSIHRNETRSSFALTAAAVSTLHAAGVYDAPELRKGMDHLRKTFGEANYRPSDRSIRDQFFFYGALYASQAFFQAGGEDWARWYAAIRRYLIEKQSSDGSWEDEYGPEFGTAMAVLILEIPIQYLPIFQR